MSLRRHRRWGDFYAEERLAPMAELAAARLDASTRAAIDSVMARCRAGDFDDDDRPARLHGDLWSGNVMWTRDGVVLIDPAAHAGHRETDLAMLALFGCPHYDAVLAGYQRVRPLQPGWRNRIGLHQLFPLLAHVVLFGAGYARADTCRRPRRAGRLTPARLSAMTIDVWMQHPTARFLRSDMLASLRRWTGGSIPDTDIPIEVTIASMDAADVSLGLLSAWRGPGRSGSDLQ